MVSSALSNILFWWFIIIYMPLLHKLRNQPHGIMLERLYFYVLLLCSITAFSQVGAKGTIIDEIAKKPLQDVKVRMNFPRRYTKTDSKGRYMLQLPWGDLLLFLLLSGYTTRKEVVMIRKERRQLLDPYALSPDHAQETE